MNLAQPEGQEEDGGGGEGDMEPPPPPPPPDEALCAGRGMEVAAEAALAGGPLEGREEDAEGSCGPRGWEQSLSPELQQAYRILSEFLLEKHRPLTTPFLRASEDRRAEDGPCEVASSSCQGSSRHQPPPRPQQPTLLKMEEKFSGGQYTGIADFVADFRLMLETCYRLHGVDHWLSKQAQKLEMMLEQKLALLSR